MRVQPVRPCVIALLAGLCLLPVAPAGAQPGAGAPAVTSPPTPVPPTTPAPTSPPAVTTPPSGTAPKRGPSDESGEVPGLSGDATMQTLDVAARPVALLHGSASWEDGFKTLRAAIDKINAELAKAGVQPSGRPIADFVQVNDSNFTFDAMIPIQATPEGKTELADGVRFGMSPGGKALKFQHRGAYDDIESTYDLITAFLDEKGLKAQDFFIEEYLTPLKDSEDQTLEVDIYIFLQ